MSDTDELFSERDLFLMKEAHNAGQHYESLGAWLDEVIADGGYVVAQHLAHDADQKQAARAQGGTVAARLCTERTGALTSVTTSEHEMQTYAKRGRTIEPLVVARPQPDDLRESGEAVSLSDSRTGWVYLAGPMTGIEEYNYPAFNRAAAELTDQGMQVINPTDHGIVEGAIWSDYLRYDISGLARCEKIALLPGWENSKGATLEKHIADELGMEVIFLDGAAATPHPARSQAVRSGAGVPEGWRIRRMPYDTLEAGKIHVSSPGDHHCMLERIPQAPAHHPMNMLYGLAEAFLSDSNAPAEQGAEL